MAATSRPVHVHVLLWGLVVAVALIVRPPLPVDETRYLAVAWDMWLENHYLVPYLNGEPYSHKPPLLFWLMTAGWQLFGVNEWWPRLVAPLFGLGTMILTGRLAAVLWPGRADVAGTAPLLMFSALFWTVFTTLTMFDMMLAFFAVAALIALVTAARTGRMRGFVLAGVMIGIGVLAKGPAILLHYLPVALTALLWIPHLLDRDTSVTWAWPKWYGGVILSVICAAAVGLTWAVPAGIAGGEAYRDAIFWGQSAGRVVNSFAHARPYWWYAAMLPGLVLPWLIWPPLWRRARTLWTDHMDGGQRLCLIWFGAAFFVFSSVSGKQLHYLLPEFPALALLASFALGSGADQGRRFDSWLPGGFFVLGGLALVVVPHIPLSGRVAETVAEAHTLWGLVLVAAGTYVIWVRAGVGGISLASALTVTAIYLAAQPVFDKRYDLTPVAREIQAYQAAGTPVANFSKYHGQYHYLGRLRAPVTVIGQLNDDEERFLAAHPNGVVVAYHRVLPTQAKPLSTHTYRRMIVAFWPAQALIDHPGIAERR